MIAKDMKIAEVMKIAPQATEVMLEYGLHCVGCAINEYETIEQGALGHGMSEEMVNTMVDEINMMINKKPKYPLNDFGITISPNAIQILDDLVTEETKKEIRGVKVKATKEGSDIEYFLDLVEAPEKGDLEFVGANLPQSKKDLFIYIDQNSLDMIKPSIVDFVQTVNGEGFKIINLS